jgi:MFS family permease
MKGHFRGWWIVAVAFIAQAITIGLTIIPYGLFTTPVVEEFDTSIATVQGGLALFVLVMTGAGSWIGGLLDRGSIRAIMASGSLLIALCFLAMSLATELWQLALLFGVGAGCGVAMAGPLAATTVIAKWFDEKRGLAIGIAAMGPPAGGLLLTPLAGWLLVDLGWRETLVVFAWIAALLAPLAWLVVRNTPGDVGQHADGRDSDVPGPATAETAGWSAREILASRNFWGLALTMGVVFGLGGGWNANAPRFGEDLGYSLQHMSTLIGIAAGLGIPATLLFGTLADRYDNRALLWLGIGMQAGALLLLWTLPGEKLFTFAILLFGFAGGSLLPVYATFIGRLFGSASFGSVMGLAGLVMLPFGVAAPVVAGAVRDAGGSYESALLAFALAFAVGASTLTWIRTRPSPSGSNP